MAGIRFICIFLSLFSPVRVLTAQSIQITEIHYDPSTNQGSDTNYEFIELYNSGSSSVDLTDYYFSGITYTFPSGTSLAAGSYLIIARKSDNYSGSLEWSSGALTNGGETLKLYDGSGNTVDEVTFDNSSPWPTPPNGDGPSLELKDTSLDNGNGSNWTYSYHSGGTPGYANQSIQISGSAGWRILSLPLQNKTYENLLGGIWTQGFTGADVTSGTANVYTYDGNSWLSINNQADTPTAGVGFLVYIFSDDNNNGVSDGFPKTISLGGDEHSATVSVTTTASTWNLLGNPFTHTIDADKLSLGGSGSGTNDNYETVVYVWDNSSGTFKSYDSATSSGTLTGGLIEPFQGFLIESKTSGTQFDFKSSAKAISSGLFYKDSAIPQIKVSGSSESFYDSAILNLLSSIPLNSKGAKKLKPVDARERILMAFFRDFTPMEILNVLTGDTIVSIPFDALLIDNNWATKPSDISLNWELINIPDNLTVHLKDNESGKLINLLDKDTISFSNKNVLPPNFDNNNIGHIPQYRMPRFELIIEPIIKLGTHSTPSQFKLHPAFPNPFNGSTTLSFEIPENGGPVRVDIYNIRGERVDQIVNEPQLVGKHSIQWNPNPLPSGIYFCRMQFESQSKTVKLLFMK